MLGGVGMFVSVSLYVFECVGGWIDGVSWKVGWVWVYVKGVVEWVLML